ncbi:MAG: DUF4129 domain-containing protein [Thermoflexales bacterium]
MSRARLALIGLYALGDACALAAPLTLLGPPAARLSLAAAFIVVVLSLSGTAASRVSVVAANVDRVPRIGILVGLFTLIAFLMAAFSGRTLSAIGIGVAAALVLWWRGMALGGEEFQPDGVRMRLWLGLVLVAVIGMAAAEPILIFLFVAATLLALHIAHLVSVAKNRDVDPRAFAHPRWARAILAIEAGVLILLLLEMLVFNTEVVARIAQIAVVALIFPFAVLVALIGSLILLIISPELIAELMRRIAEFMQARLRAFGSGNGAADLTQQASDPISPVVSVALVIGLIIAAIIVVVLIAGAARVAAKRRLARPPGDMPEAAPELDAETDALRSVGGRVGARLSKLFAAATIRLIYARLTAEAARRGARRAPAQTALEYLPGLARVFPGADADARRVTDAYIAAHYGEVPDTLDKLRAIQAAWARLRRIEPPVVPDAAPALRLLRQTQGSTQGSAQAPEPPGSSTT